MNDQAARIATFRALHQSGCFVIPNPWDVGSAKLLAMLGFKALASTSSGLAWSLGKRDTQVSLAEVLDHLSSITGAVDLPVNADFEGGYAIAADDVANNVALAAVTGIAGLSIEDSTGNAGDPLFPFDLAVDRIRAARSALVANATTEGAVLLTARCEGYLVGQPDIDAIVNRLVAYAEAGADVLYAPGIRSTDDIATVVAAVAPNPVNVLVSTGFTTVKELSGLGVRRISVGGALARAAWGEFLRAAGEIAQEGTFDALTRAVPFGELNEKM